MMFLLLRTLALLALGLAASPGVLAQPAEPIRAITQLAGSVYRFQSDDHYGVFMVTPAGVIVADPLSTDTARWLQQQIEQRFALPVKYVLYSHDHGDHAAGAEVFTDAVIVAHANAAPHIAASEPPVAAPDLTFSSELVVNLGGQSVHLYYLGVSHSDNLVYMVFPQQRILFAVDVMAVRRLPFRDFPGTDIDGLIGALTALEGMDVDIVVPGHGDIGTLADVRAHRIYIEELKDQVTELLRAGNSDAAIKNAVTMPQYSSWASYAQWQQANVDGMIAYVKSHYRF